VVVNYLGLIMWLGRISGLAATAIDDKLKTSVRILIAWQLFFDE